jgi:chemotaxis protein CheD
MSEANTIEVETGEVRVARAPALLRCSALGSCVAVFLYDEQHLIGGVAHVMLPSVEYYLKGDTLTKYADFAIDDLLRRMKATHDTLHEYSASCKEGMRAKLVGGALVVAGVEDIGHENTDAITSKLAKEKIVIEATHIGGILPTHATFDCTSGIVRYGVPGESDMVL